MHNKIDYAHRAKVLTEPNENGIAPFQEVIAQTSEGIYHLTLKIIEPLNDNWLHVECITNNFSYRINLDNGDIDFLDELFLEMAVTPNIVKVVRKYDKLGLDFTKED